MSPGADLNVSKSGPKLITVEPIPIAPVNLVLSTDCDTPDVLKIFSLFAWLTVESALIVSL